jgi:hypothetical protein
MNCAEWELRILLSLEGEADPAAAEHLRYCPSCASLAADLDKQTQALRTLPPEAAAVDYPALRTAAAREAVLRKRRRKVLAALALAAAVLLASLLALYRNVPYPARSVPVEVPPAQVARVVPPVAAPPTVRRAKPQHPKPEPFSDLDRQFAAYLRSLEAPLHHDTPSPDNSPEILRVSTSNPNVKIIWLQESKGTPHD